MADPNIRFSLPVKNYDEFQDNLRMADNDPLQKLSHAGRVFLFYLINKQQVDITLTEKYAGPDLLDGDQTIIAAVLQHCRNNCTNYHDHVEYISRIIVPITTRLMHVFVLHHLTAGLEPELLDGK
jgi:hypothetical protein